MNVKEISAKWVWRLCLVAVVGGFTINWQGSSRLDAKPPQQTVRYTVTTVLEEPLESDLVIVGVFGETGLEWTGEADGRTDRDSVIVNRPSPAVMMDFLDLGPLTPFEAGTIYSIDDSGSMGIHDSNRGADFRYFFRGPGLEEGTVVHYRLDGDAVIVGDGFPNGDPDGYMVFVENLRVSQDTGKKGNAYEGIFPDATAIFRLEPK